MKITLPHWRQSITGPLLIVGFEEGLLWYAVSLADKVIVKIPRLLVMEPKVVP